MDHDFMKRGYLLPNGCKDLIDVLKLKPSFIAEDCKNLIDISKLKPQVFKLKPKQQSPKHPVPLPSIVGEIVIPEQTSVSQLAAILGKKPFQIIADVMELGVFANVKQPLDFKIISSVARKYG